MPPKGLLADVNCEGQAALLIGRLERPAWRELWEALSLSLSHVSDWGLEREASDREVWSLCQREALVLITSNRNADGPDSLEAVLATAVASDSIPVVTIADPRRLATDADYAERAAEHLITILYDIDRFSGCGRLYIP